MIELIFGPYDAGVDDQPGRDKVVPTKQGVTIRDLKRLRMAIRKRVDGQGYDVVKGASRNVSRRRWNILLRA